jgi:hypothetical protein
VVQCLVVGVFYENERGFCLKDCEYRQTQMADNSFRRFTRLALKGGTLERGMLERWNVERWNVECYFLPFNVIYQYFELICLV